MTRYELTSPDWSFDVQVEPSDGGFKVRIDDSFYFLKLKRGGGRNQFIVEVADKPVSVTLLEASNQRVDLDLDGERLSFQRPAAPIGQAAPLASALSAPKGLVTAPMPGKVIGALVKKGEKVKAGDPLIILESMKMEIAVRSDRDAEVKDILVDEGASVKRGQGLVRLG
jgi:biotin carboxyl carrier protein